MPGGPGPYSETLFGLSHIQALLNGKSDPKQNLWITEAEAVSTDSRNWREEPYAISFQPKLAFLKVEGLRSSPLAR